MRSWPLYLIFILILVLSPLWMDSYGIYILSMALVMSIAAVGLDVLMGYAGQVCFGQAGFVAVGAYVTAFLVNQGLSFWISWPIGGLMAGFSGFIIGAPALKIRGHYLALATLSFAYIIYLVLMHWESVTGGPRGMLALRPDWPLSFEGDISIFYLILGSTIAMFILARNIISSKYGRAFMSLQKDEIVSKNMGINLFRYKTLAFIISSIYGGIAGGLYGPLIGFLDPLSFGVLESAYFMLMVLMGGRGTLIGGILGAFIYVSIPEFFRSTAYFQEVIYGFIFLIVLIYVPAGIAGFFSNKRSFFAENVKKVKIFKKIFSATEGERGVFQSHNSMPAMNNPTPMNREKSTGNKILEFNSITMKFGGLEALKAVSFHLQEGKVFGLIGPNGAGKTTAINVITGLYKPQEGEVIFSDENLLDVKPDKLIGIGISRTFQNVGLFEGLTVLENVMVGLHPFGKGGFFQSALKLKNARDDEAWRMARAIEMLKLVKMEGLATQVATDLPYGQQKLVALARALVSEPCLMLLDEPAAGLSRKEIEHLMSLIRTTGDKTGCTILLVEHDMDVVMGVSDHIFVLNFGVKISEGNPEQIRSDPLVVEAYLGEEEVEYYA